MYKDVRRKYLHGEIVAMALPLQLAVNGRPEADIEELKAFLREVGIPVSIRAVSYTHLMVTACLPQAWQLLKGLSRL